MSRIISFVNQSGGMGKTTLTANLGYHLAQRDHKILMIDMDSQASLTRYLGLQPSELELTIIDVLLEQRSAPVHKNWYGADLVPANSELVSLYTALSTLEQWQFLLKAIVDPLRKLYDFILIDCPPNLGPLSVMSLIASTHLIMPVRTNSKGLEGAEDLRETIDTIREQANRRLLIAGAVPTMFDTRAKHDKEHLQQIYDAFRQLRVFSPIPKATDLDNAWNARQPIAVFNKRHVAIPPLEELATHLEHC